MNTLRKDPEQRISLLQQQKVDQEQLLSAIGNEADLILYTNSATYTGDIKDEKQRQIVENLDKQYMETRSNIRKITKEINRLTDKYFVVAKAAYI